MNPAVLAWRAWLKAGSPGPAPVQLELWRRAEAEAARKLDAPRRRRKR